MRIAVVHSYYSSSAPSGENAAVDVQVSALRRAGHEVELVTRHTDQLRGAALYPLRAGVATATGSGPSPIEQLRQFRPDVIHVHNLFPNWGTRWFADAPAPVVATLHNFRTVCAAATLFRDGHDCALCPEQGSMNAVRHSCYRGSSIASIPLAIRTRGGVSGDPLISASRRVVVLSPRGMNTWIGLGLDRDLIEVMPNFVADHGPVSPPLGSSPWVFLGRLTEEKGILPLLDAWPTEVPLAIYGDGPLRQEVEARCSGSVVYRGQAPSGEIPRILAQSIGLVFPSTWQEGAPMVYPEALVAGRPVLAKQGNSVADDVAASGVGAVFQDWSELPGLLRSFSDPAVLAAAAARARSRFDEEFSEPIWAARMTAVYRAVVGRG